VSGATARAARAAAGAALAAAALAVATTIAAALSWGPETNVTNTATDSEWGLNHRGLATTPDGTLHVVWAERDGPNATYRIWTRRLAAGTWGTPERIVDYLATDPGNPGDDIGAKYPALAVAPNGELHLFWHDYRVGGIDNVELFWKMRPAAGAWDPSRAADVRLTTSEHPETPGQNAYVPVPVAASGGAIHLAWYDYRFDASSAEILSRTRPAGGEWDLAPGDSVDDRVTTDAAHSELVDLAVDAGGRVHAVWRSVEGGARIRCATRDPGTGTWSAPFPVDDTGTVAGAPAAAVDGDGTLHVVWPDSRDGGRALFTRTRDANGTWSPAPARLTRPAEGADEPSLAAGTDGTLHLVFSDGRAGLLNREIFHRMRAPGAAWDTTGAGDDRISNASGSSVRPCVDVHGDVVTVAWKDARDGNHEVYVRRGGPFALAAPPEARAPAWTVLPNPVRAPDRVVFAPRTATPGAAVCVLLDVRGRRVRRLAADAAGKVAWDLRDDAGRRAPAGVYFLHGAGGTVARVTVLR